MADTVPPPSSADNPGFQYIEPDNTRLNEGLTAWVDSLDPAEKTQIALRYTAWKYGGRRHGW